MSVINVNNLSFTYDGSYTPVFENVSFRIDTDWKLGLTGRNGRGKTTFLNLLLGKHEYTGSITASIDFDIFPPEIPDKTLNGIDISYNLAPEVEDWEIYRELSLLDLDSDILYRPYNTLSGGEQTKLTLAALFLKQNNFLLIDEPTNHLDANARELIGRYLEGKKGFVLVSHERALLERCTDHTLAINRTNIEIISGNFSVWYENKQMQDEYETAKNARLKGEIKRLTAASREKAEWSDKVEGTKIGTHQGDRGRVGHLAAKMMKRSKSIEKRYERDIEEKSQLLKNIETAEDLHLSPLTHHAKPMVSAKNLSLFYGEKNVCENINFEINSGERIALKGANGSGKSSILKLICGENIKYTGDFYKASNLKISYVSQDTSALWGTLREYAAQYDVIESLFKSILRKLDFSREQFDKNIENYSEGQKKKVMIARSLCEQAHLYVWDEPLNFIDILSRMQIEGLILNSQPTMIFVEHDEVFTAKVAGRVLTC